MYIILLSCKNAHIKQYNIIIKFYSQNDRTTEHVW